MVLYLSICIWPITHLNYELERVQVMAWSFCWHEIAKHLSLFGMKILVNKQGLGKEKNSIYWSLLHVFKMFASSLLVQHCLLMELIVKRIKPALLLHIYLKAPSWTPSLFKIVAFHCIWDGNSQYNSLFGFILKTTKGLGA